MSMATTQLEQQQLLIGGTWMGAGSGAAFETTDPYTGESAGVAAAAGRDDARAAVDAARAAFPAWAATPPAERAAVLRRASEILMERQADIAAIVTEETGGTFGWGMFNVELGAGMLAFNAEQAGALATP